MFIVLCMTYPTASQHLCINAWLYYNACSWYSRNLKTNKHQREKTTTKRNKIRRQRLGVVKNQVKQRLKHINKAKEKKQEWIKVFGRVCVHIPTVCVRMQGACTCIHTRKPNPKTQNRKTKKTENLST